MYLLRVLNDMNFKVGVYTLEYDLKVLDAILERSKLEVDFYSLRSLLGGPSRLYRKSIYKFLIYSYMFNKINKSIIRNRYDLIINSKANEAPSDADICIVHYPLGHALHYWDRVYLGAGIDPKYTTKLLWKLYIQPFRVVFRRLSDTIRQCRVIVANSSWTAIHLRELAGIEAFVVYPPIPVKEYVNVSYYNEKEKDLVVTVSRFDPSKNLEGLFYVAKLVPEVEFALIGRVGDSTSYKYYIKLRRLKERLGLRNLYLLPNLDEKSKKLILRAAKVYFHPTIGEHLGIAVLEGLVSGAVPVVHQYSGSCIDIVRMGKYGYCYSTYKEAAEIIRDVIRYDIRPDKHYLDSLLLEFSYEAFKRKFNEVIRRLLEEKGF